MLLKPVYQKGVHVRPASVAEFAVLKERHDLAPGDAGFTRMIETDGDSFVVSAEPSWREADRKFEDPSLFDSAQPWPQTSPWSTAASADVALVAVAGPHGDGSGTRWWMPAGRRIRRPA
ncbi:hypothetical protein ACIOHS_00220 [Streptomyces sp. NPDC088253]|uniref:hypothetical protein n=1 Tax=Streptomyces sp. NPDC088253 TaxID=3365846 RepID=UPI00382675D3